MLKFDLCILYILALWMCSKYCQSFQITGGGLWTQSSAETERVSFQKGILTETSKGPEMNENNITILSPKFWSNLLCSGATKSKLISKFWKNDKELLEPQVGKGPDTSISNSVLCDLSMKSEAKDMQIGKPVSVGESLVEAKSRFYSKWKMPVVSFWSSASQYSSYALELWVRTNFHCHAFLLLFLGIIFFGRQDCKIPTSGSYLKLYAEIRNSCNQEFIYIL